MSATAIKIENISKVYRIGQSSGGNFRETLNNKFNALFGSESSETEEFWALKNINLEITAGETVGIVGKNGAGKSTLLKILSRITPPTEGTINIYGRVSSLLEVGTGFHPDLTGKENIYMNGAILGMKKSEIRSKFDEIVAFSGVEKFLNTPVKRYSSGMHVRLAFAVAAHLEPEILIVDEVLAVGDAEFQKKCLGKMGEVAQSGRTILFVSHNLGAIAELCSRSVLLKNGILVKDGQTGDIISEYMGNVDQKVNHFELDEEQDLPCYVYKVEVCNNSNEMKSEFNFGDLIKLRLKYKVKHGKKDFNLEFNLFRNYSCVFTTFNTDNNETENYWEKGTYDVEILIPGNYLKAGNYSLNLIARGLLNGGAIQRLEKVISFTITEHLVNLTHKGYKEGRWGDTVFPGTWNIKKVL